MKSRTGLLVAVVFVACTAATLYQLRRLDARLDAHEVQLARLDAAFVVSRPEPVTVQLVEGRNWRSIGRRDAPVTIVEFTDYECPFCKQFHAEVFPDIVRDYIESGRVRWISRDLPLPIHPHAAQAAQAAHCAGDQGKYWLLRTALLSSDTLLTRPILTRTAQRLSLDMSRFRLCLDSQKYRPWVANDVADARVLQITGTPAFVIAKSDSSVLAGALLVGTQSFDVFESAIDALLKE